MVDKYTPTSLETGLVRDKDWVRKMFALGQSDIDKAIRKWRVFTTANNKFTDTSLGGNFAINNPPQYTPNADIRRSGISIAGRDTGAKAKGNVVPEQASLGMGRFYSEQIDDNSQNIHMQFGTLKFRGMLAFFTGFYSNSASVLAREGRATIAYYIGRIAGAILTLPLMPFIMAGQAFRYLSNRPSTKYASMMPQMTLYWSRCNFIANAIGANSKVIARVFDDPKDETNAADMVVDETVPMTAEYRGYMAKLAPSIFRKDGMVDLFATANKAQRLANQRRRELQKIGETATSQKDLQVKLQAYLSNSALTDQGGRWTDITDYLKAYHQTVAGDLQFSESSEFDKSLEEKGKSLSTATVEELPPTDAAAATPTTDEGGAATAAPSANEPPKDEGKPGFFSRMFTASDGVVSWIKGTSTQMGEFMEADADHGSAFVTFRVEYTGEQSESFSNQVEQAAIAQKINGISASAKSIRHSFSDGQTGIGAVDLITNSVRDLIGGAMDSVHISGLLSLAGNAFVDIPKVWADSSASFPTTSYTIHLRTPYGNPIARYQNLYIPMAMLLAAALPVSSGNQSYTSPFYCSLFSKGFQTIRLGMVTELSITRGVGNLGFNQDWESLGYDVRFTVADLSAIMHAPITTGFSILNPFQRIFSDDNAFSDYLAALSSMDYKDQYYKQRQLFYNMTKVWADARSWLSPANTTSMIGNSNIGMTLTSLFGDAYRTNSR